MKQVTEGKIYKGVEPYDLDCDGTKYDHYLCCHTGNFWLVDCFPCSKDGDIHPGYFAAVLVRTDNLL